MLSPILNIRTNTTYINKINEREENNKSNPDVEWWAILRLFTSNFIDQIIYVVIERASLVH